jgi:transposase
LEHRSLVRTRYSFVTKQTRCKNQIKALLGFYGYSIPQEMATGHWSRRFIAWLQQLTFTSASGHQALGSLLEELLFLRQTIVGLTKQIRALATTEPYRSSVSYLQSIHGLSTLSAMTLLVELVEINRFGPLDRLASFCGLVPDEHSTGEEQTILGITRRRNPLLRTVLIECAWTAVRKDPALLMAFTKLSARMPKNRAIVRIARKLLNRIRFVLKHQQPYQPGVVLAQG